MKNHKLSRVFIGAIFLINLITNTLIAIAVALSFALGAFNEITPLLLTAVYIISVTLIGSALAAIVGKRLFSQFTELSEAMKRVAGGDYDVRVEEGRDIDEVRDMTVSFNAMARELGMTELMRKDFVSNVSHEFKTPLSVIEGYAALIGRECADERCRDYAGRISASAKRLSKLAGNILLLSRLDNEAISIEKAPFRLDKRLREAVVLHERGWTEKNLALDLDLPEVEITGSSDLLDEVWSNLIGNAVKFSQEGGTLGVRITESADEVAVAVSDTGCGIPAEARERIFEKFYQADSSRASEGNGLGLALARRIVELHGGSIEVESEVGAGSTFTVRIKETLTKCGFGA
ncbi:MAG: HAMP domain-containing histidine kinase [Oscillospiraceae bacterium]|nr:HAMP domain-containing histidine kinase [Oscillospiraceae bacterium]